MTSLRLDISKGEDPALSEVSFCHPAAGGIRRSVRGQRPLAGEGVFQWSQAVQALTILILRYKAAGIIGAEQPVSPELGVLTGEAGSPAASLDYAFSKQPTWILDMFGIDSRGTPLVKKLVLRSNPERKRPGPVILRINGNFICPDQIAILLGGVSQTNPQELIKIAEQIETRFTESRANALSERNAAAELPALESSADPSPLAAALARFRAEQQLYGPLARPFDNENWLKRLCAGLKSDIRHALLATDSFSAKGLEQQLARINTNPVFMELSGGERLLFNSSANTPTNLGLAADQERAAELLSAGPPIGISVAGYFSTEMTLLTYLKRVKGYRLSLNYNFVTTSDVAEHIGQGEPHSLPEIFVLGLGAAAQYLKFSHTDSYLPFALLPAEPHRLIGPVGAPVDQVRSLWGYYVLSGSPLVTSAVYFRNLIEEGLLPRTVSQEYLEPEDRLRALCSGDSSVRSPVYMCDFHLLQSLAPFPSWYLDNRAVSDIPLIAFARRDFAQTPQAQSLALAIRGAWIDLLENPFLLDATLCYMVEDRDLVKVVKRTTGFYGLALEHLQTTFEDCLDAVPPTVSGPYGMPQADISLNCLQPAVPV